MIVTEIDLTLLYLLRQKEVMLVEIDTKMILDTDNMTDEYILEKMATNLYGFVAVTVQ